MDQDVGRLVLRAEDRADADSGDAPSMWRRLEATLAYDSRLQPPVAGVRGSTAGQTRLMYTARGNEIDVQIRPGVSEGRVRMLGQVLDEGFEPASGWLTVESPGGSARVDLDECGHFAIDGLAVGRQRIEVHLPHALIVVPAVHI